MTTFVFTPEVPASGIMTLWSSLEAVPPVKPPRPPASQNPVVPDEFGSGAENLRKMYNDLKGLFIVDPDDSSVPPLPRTLERAYAILERTAYAMMRQQTGSESVASEFPRGYVTTDDKGGIRIEWWHKQTHCVSLVVGSSKKSKPYAFVKFGATDSGHIDRRVIPAQLAARLQELNMVTVQIG